MRIIKKILKYFLAFFFSFLPRSKHIWLTGKPTSWGYDGFTPPDFFDNSKYFFLYLVNNTKEKAFWVSSSKNEIALLKKYNLPFMKYGSLKYYFYTLRAKYFFHHYGISQIDPILQGNSVQIDFWHGTPLKKIRYDVVPKTNIKMNFLARFIGMNKTEYLASTSKYVSENILSKAFDLPLNQCLDFGYPRTDIFSCTKTETKEFCKRYAQELLPYIEIASNFKKVFLYMPTWRDDDPDYFSKININFESLNETLKELNYGFFLKMHPLTRNVPVKKYSHIFQINNDVDIYPFLVFTDFLITDYSSIFFDYLLLNKEIIFIPYDFENYTEKRNLYFDYDEITPGIKYKSFEEFTEALYEVEKLNFQQERKRVRELLVSDYHYDACEKTYLYFSQKGGQK